MSQIRKIGISLGRAVLGAFAGTISCLTLIGFVDTAISYYPNDRAGFRLFLLGVGLGGTGGAALAMVGGGREIRGWAKSIITGTLAGFLFGLLGGLLFAAITASLHDSSMWGKFGAEYRFTGLCIGLPAGSLLGGMVGAIRGRKGTPPTIKSGTSGHDP